VARLPAERGKATLVAFLRTLEASAQDDVLDLFDIVVIKLITDAAAVAKCASRSCRNPSGSFQFRKGAA